MYTRYDRSKPIYFETNPSSLLSTHTCTFACVSLGEHAPYLVAAVMTVRWLPERFPELSKMCEFKKKSLKIVGDECSFQEFTNCKTS